MGITQKKLETEERTLEDDQPFIFRQLDTAVEVNELMKRITRKNVFCALEIIEGQGLQIGRGKIPILINLSNIGSTNQKELAEKLSIRPATLSIALQKMENDGLIQRTVDKQDQRKIIVSLSQKGAQFVDKAQYIYIEMCKKMVEALSEEEQNILLGLLRKIC